MNTGGIITRPSTKSGNLLGRSIVGVARLADYWVPLAGIRVYQLIPPATRGRMFGGPSGSHTVAARIREAGGTGWSIMADWMISNHPERPSLP